MVLEGTAEAVTRAEAFVEQLVADKLRALKEANVGRNW